MTRVKRGLVSRRKHKNLLKLTKGFRGTKKKLVKTATEASLHAGEYAFAGRKLKKKDFRSLWITRISGKVKQSGLSYSRFINGLKKANIKLDRKILSNLVVEDAETFEKIVDEVKHSN